MNRRSFVKGLALAATAPATALAVKNVYESYDQLRRDSTEKIWIGRNLNHENDKEMIKVAEQLSAKMGEILESNRPVKKITIRWVNILTKNENPWGEVGHFEILSER